MRKQLAPHIARIRAGYAGKFSGRRFRPTTLYSEIPPEYPDPRYISRCCDALAYPVDGDPDNGFECSECGKECEVEGDEPLDRLAAQHEKARRRGWED